MVASDNHSTRALRNEERLFPINTSFARDSALEATRTQGRFSFDSSHRVSVHELAVAERVLAKLAFDLESEFAIERDRRLIVREDGQFYSGKVQPFVGQINHRLHHRFSNAFALPIVANHHPDLATVVYSRPR